MLWQLELLPDDSRNPGTLLGQPNPIIGPDGTIYCQSENKVFAVTSSGTLRWQDSLNVLGNWTRIDLEWATFTRNGELVFVAGDRWVMANSPAAAMVATLGSMLAKDERLVCLGSDGTVRWEQAIPSSFAWSLPRSAWDLRWTWESRMGLRQAKNLGGLTTGPDGRIYVSGRVAGKPMTWAIRGD